MWWGNLFGNDLVMLMLALEKWWSGGGWQTP